MKSKNSPKSHHPEIITQGFGELFQIKKMYLLGNNVIFTSNLCFLQRKLMCLQPILTNVMQGASLWWLKPIFSFCYLLLNQESKN